MPHRWRYFRNETAVRQAENMIMISFMEKTWFPWWMFAMIVVVRWFHMLQPTSRLERFDEAVSAPQQACSDSGEFSSPNATGLLV
jgi:hypothetical protein